MLKKIFLFLACTNVVIAVPVEDFKKKVDTEFTERQIVALKNIRVLDALATGVLLASGAVSRLPEGTSRIVKTAVFVPVSLFFAASGYIGWEEYNMNGFYKRHKWLLLGL